MAILSLNNYAGAQAISEKFGDFDISENVFSELNRKVGRENIDGSWGVVADDQRDHMLYGPYKSWSYLGGGLVNFRMKIENNTADNHEIIFLDLYDATEGEVIASRAVRRRDFYQSDEYQNFELWFDFNQERLNHNLETRVFFNGGAVVSVADVSIHFDSFDSSLPEINNQSSASDEHVNYLVNKAIRGMHQDWLTQTQRDDSRNLEEPYLLKAPNANDLFFVGKYYIAWIDQTGFYGKMNGLWILNGQTGNDLNFVHREEDDRAVNFLIVAENGDGEWPENYTGAEHYEIPNLTAEYIGDKSVGSERRFAQYSLNEAPKVNANPLWDSCNNNTMAWSRHVRPIQQEQTSDGLILAYQGPITKRGDDGGQEENCHGDYLFPAESKNNSEGDPTITGKRSQVRLQVGYKLYADKPYLDRTFEIINPEGNPTYGYNNWGIIGGFVLTQWPNPHPLKEDLMRFFSSNETDRDLKYGPISLENVSPNYWTYNHSETEWRQPKSDYLVGWYGEGYKFSARGRAELGYSFGQELFGDKEIGDIGFCFCVAHGGLEVGGSVLNGYRHNPNNPYIVPGGESSGVVTRRLNLLPNTIGINPPPVVNVY
ncbi:hypothetical protein GCM10007877_03240 [Marinibactrum halimedae]|uniref:Uncharacterized protein n=2 Tax=Marinibactrum halimedae TaxID=1444977 RepID=A0AA37T6S4_9GAMM|nr:hypothetical protein GCM10007877_03240 [Marinibactrum halimedae]